MIILRFVQLGPVDRKKTENVKPRVVLTYKSVTVRLKCPVGHVKRPQPEKREYPIELSEVLKFYGYVCSYCGMTDRTVGRPTDRPAYVPGHTLEFLFFLLF